MEDVIKYNIKKVNNKTLLTQKQEIRQVTYMLTYIEFKILTLENNISLKNKNCIALTITYKGFK